MNIELTIITPTYNRSKLLTRLYESLCKQTNKNFQWLIIDDGSTDNTKSEVKKYINDNFIIEYHSKKNGGKHTALNLSHRFIMGKYVCIVDSDDFLIPQAVERIVNDFKKYENNSKIACLSYLRGKSIDNALTKVPECNYIVSDYISFRVNQEYKGDMFEVMRSQVFLEYNFPVFKNEKFMLESWLFNNIAQRYKTVYINEIIYISNYLPTGLTQSARKLRYNNPKGAMADCESYFSPKVKLKIRLKYYLLFDMFGYASNEKIQNIIRKKNMPVLYLFILPSFFLSKWWKYKYCAN